MQATAQTLRVSAPDLKRRLDGGESATLLDTRGQQGWDASNEKMRGAIRVDPQDIHINPAWPKDRLTVAYCT